MVTGRSMGRVRASGGLSGEICGAGDEVEAHDARICSSQASQAAWRSESRALVALRELAREGGANVRRGALALAGMARPAWLAMTRDGRLLAAVLIGDGAAGSEGGG